MGKTVATILFLILGVAIGLWLALGPQTPEGITQAWDQVKASAQQLWANAEMKIREAQSPVVQRPSGPGLLESITAPFKAFAAAVQGFWQSMGSGIRPLSP